MYARLVSVLELNCVVATARTAVIDLARYTGMKWLICTCRLGAWGRENAKAVWNIFWHFACDIRIWASLKTPFFSIYYGVHFFYNPIYHTKVH